MSDNVKCEYCSRPIKREPFEKVLRGKKHTFCSEFCFLHYFYDVPTISYDDLQKMYSLRCISVLAPDASPESRMAVPSNTDQQNP